MWQAWTKANRYNLPSDFCTQKGKVFSTSYANENKGAQMNEYMSHTTIDNDRKKQVKRLNVLIWIFGVLTVIGFGLVVKYGYDVYKIQTDTAFWAKVRHRNEIIRQCTEQELQKEQADKK